MNMEDERLRLVHDWLLTAGPEALSYPERNKYTIKQHMDKLFKDPKFISLLPSKSSPSFLSRNPRLLELNGTIPILHQNCRYNIPVSVTIPAEYPLAPPLCHVRPSSTMALAPSNPYLDPQSGQVLTPVQSEWLSPRNTLLDCMDEMCNLFGSHPPVYAHPVPGPTYSSPSASSGAGSAGISSFNPYTPNPLAGAAAKPAAMPNPYPTYPPVGVRPDGRAAAHPLYPRVGGSFAPPPQPPAQPVSSSLPQPSPPPPPPVEQPAFASSVQQRERAFKESAVAALEERLVSSLEASVPAIEDALVDMNSKASVLQQNHQVLEKAICGKKEELTVMERNVDTLSRSIRALQTWLTANEPKVAAAEAAAGGAAGALNGATVDVAPLRHEDVIVATDALSKQALEAQAKDMAYEDALDLLTEALGGGALSLDAYVRHARRIAHDQFLVRLLGTKLQAAQAAKGRDGAQGGAIAQGEVRLPQGDAWSRTATYAIGGMQS